MGIYTATSKTAIFTKDLTGVSTLQLIGGLWEDPASNLSQVAVSDPITIFRDTFSNTNNILIKKIRVDIPNLKGLELTNISTVGNLVLPSVVITPGLAPFPIVNSVTLNFAKFGEWTEINKLIQIKNTVGVGPITVKEVNSLFYDPRNIQSIYDGIDFNIVVQIEIETIGVS